MRIRTWLFAGVVALVAALNLALVSLRIAQTGEDTVRARISLASSGLKAQLELLDARLNPRAAASLPDLIDATRASADPTVALAQPDERSLRAAAAVLSPEPDLLAVENGLGAIVSRRSKPAQQIADLAHLPLGKAVLESNPPPTFAVWEGATWRVAAARIPGNAAAVLAGGVGDGRFAAQMKSQGDADGTLLMAGKLIASSLPQREDRDRVVRWAGAPGPGYGVLQVRLPFVGTALAGKLPRGATRYAIRGALVSLDGGVQAALTVPAWPYLGWLARYQAFYLVGLALLVLFGFFWGLLSRIPAAPASMSGPAPRGQPSLVGTDVGAPMSELAPAARDVPWPHAEGASTEQHEDAERTRATNEAPKALESLDPDVLSVAAAAPAAVKGGPPPTVAEPVPSAEHPMWSADPFTPTPGQFSVEAPAEAPEEVRKTNPRGAGDNLLAGGRGGPRYAGHQAGTEAAPAHFPGDEPTRIEPVSAALLDKLREKDEAEGQPKADKATQGGGLAPPGVEAAPDSTPKRSAPRHMPEMPVSEAPPEANVTMQDFSMPGVSEADPDEQHWRETFDKFIELKVSLGEPSDKITFEKFSAKLRKNRADLLPKHNATGVRFIVYEKDGKAAIKASAIR